MFCRKNGLIIDGLLDVGHEQVDVLRSRHLVELFPLLVHPQVVPEILCQAPTFADYREQQEDLNIERPVGCGAIFVCGHRPKTKELLELFLLLLSFTIWFISSLK